MSATKGRLSVAEKGAMYSPAYGVILPVSAGTEPGIFDSAMKPKIPSIAARPLLISTSRPFAFFSGVAFLLKPKGSKRLKGSECTLSRKRSNGG